VPLLEDNGYVDNLVEFSLSGIMQLESQEFDTVINLEKNPGLCALAGRVKAWKKYGFRFDVSTGTVEAYEHSDEALYVSQDKMWKNMDQKHWMDHLFKMLGTKWQEEQPILYREKRERSLETIVGLNWLVGNKFKGKAWQTDADAPYQLWEELATKLTYDGITCERQTEMSIIKDSTTKLRTYLNWLEPFPVVVTCDSLALHVAMAYGKRVVGLFGPTRASEIQPYKHGIMIQSPTGKMEDITVGQVEGAIKELLNWGTC
jgi:heptosyltransferase-2